MRDALLVFSNPLDGRHEEFNDWYTNVHIRDVMRMPASIAVQRFVLADEQPDEHRVSRYRYLALYETDDTVKCTAAHAVAMTPKLPISETFDLTSPANYFRLRSFVTADPMAERDGGIVVAQFDDAGDFDLSAAARLAGRHGVLSVAHLSVLGDQLVPREPERRELALVRLSTSPSSVPSAADVASVVAKAATVSHYRALIRRLTADDVLHALPADIATEARARAAIENTQHRLQFKDGVVRDR